MTNSPSTEPQSGYPFENLSLPPLPARLDVYQPTDPALEDPFKQLDLPELPGEDRTNPFAALDLPELLQPSDRVYTPIKEERLKKPLPEKKSAAAGDRIKEIADGIGDFLSNRWKYRLTMILGGSAVGVTAGVATQLFGPQYGAIVSSLYPGVFGVAAGADWIARSVQVGGIKRLEKAGVKPEEIASKLNWVEKNAGNAARFLEKFISSETAKSFIPLSFMAGTIGTMETLLHFENIVKSIGQPATGTPATEAPASTPTSTPTPSETPTAPPVTSTSVTPATPEASATTGVSPTTTPGPEAATVTPVPPVSLESVVQNLPADVPVSSDVTSNSIWAASKIETAPIAQHMNLSPPEHNVVIDSLKDLLEQMGVHAEAGKTISFSSPELFHAAGARIKNTIEAVRVAVESDRGGTLPNPLTPEGLSKLRQIADEFMKK